MPYASSRTSFFVDPPPVSVPGLPFVSTSRPTRYDRVTGFTLALRNTGLFCFCPANPSSSEVVVIGAEDGRLARSMLTERCRVEWGSKFARLVADRAFKGTVIKVSRLR